MALDPEVEALIGTLPDDQQAVWREKVGKGYMRQDDYSRRMNEVARAKEEATESARRNEDWWKVTGEEAWQRAEARNQQLEAEAAELRRQVTSAAAGTAGRPAVNADELERRVKAEIESRGYMTKADTERMVKEIAQQTRKEAEESSAITTGMNMVWAQDMAYVRIKYEQEAGEPLNREEFAKFMTDKNLAGSPQRAMEEYLAPRRQAKEIEKKVEEARSLEREKMEKELAGRAMPGNAGGETSPAIRLIRREETGGFVLPPGEKLGNNAAANAAAARLRAMGHN